MSISRLLAFSPPYFINKVFLSGAACGELRVNWARPGKASQKLGCPPEPRKAVVGLLNSPERHLGLSCAHFPAGPCASQPQRTCQDWPTGFIFPSSPVSGRDIRLCMPSNWLVEIKCEDQGRFPGLGMQCLSTLQPTEQCTTAHRIPVVSFILVLVFGSPRAA